MGEHSKPFEEWIEAAALLGFATEKTFASGTIDGYRVWVWSWIEEGGAGSTAKVELSGLPPGLTMSRWTLIDSVTARVINRLPLGGVRRRIRCPGRDKKVIAPDPTELERWLTPHREAALCSVSSVIEWRRRPAPVGGMDLIEWGHQPKAHIMRLSGNHKRTRSSGEIVAFVNEALEEARQLTH